MSAKPITWRPSIEGQEAALDKIANELGISRNQALNKLFNMSAGLGTETLQDITNVGQKLQMSESEVIEMGFTKWKARFDAHIEVYGRPLVDWIKADAKTQYINYKYKAVIEYEKAIVKNIMGKQMSGVSLDDIEKRVAVKYRVEPFWSQSVECQREQEMHDEIERFKKENRIVDEPELSQEEMEEIFKK
jgi:hypothetical protein